MADGLERFYGAGDLHFITFSCYRREALLVPGARRDLLLRILERVRRRYRLVVLGYVVMPEHVHLLISEPQRGTVSTVIQALKVGFVRSLEMSGGGPRSRKIGETLRLRSGQALGHPQLRSFVGSPARAQDSAASRMTRRKEIRAMRIGVENSSMRRCRD